MINIEKFDKELEKVLEKNTNVDLKDLLLLKKAAEGEKISVSPEFLADKIVKDLFVGYNDEILIPWGFFNTELGKAILLAKYGIETDIYFVSDLVELTGKTKQFISKEIKNGNIESYKRRGIVYFSESQVNKYLEKKGYETISDRKKIAYEEKEEKLVSGKYEREEEYK